MICTCKAIGGFHVAFCPSSPRPPLLMVLMLFWKLDTTPVSFRTTLSPNLRTVFGATTF